MESALFIWFAGVVGKLSVLFNVSGIAMVVSSLVVALFRIMSWADFSPKEEDKPKLNKEFKFGVVGAIMLFVSAILPDQKTAYLAGGAYLGQKVVTSETAEKVVTLINSKLDEYIEETENTLKNKFKESGN